MIRSVLGEIPRSQLGQTLVHEHLMNQTGSLVHDDDANLNEDALVGREIGDAMKWGLRSLVEVSTFEMQRNMIGIKELAVSSGLNVIISTGFFFGPFVTEAVRSTTPRRLADAMLDDLRGENFWGISAGVIGEIGISAGGLTPWELHIHEAAALAHGETNCSIITHTCEGERALEQVQALTERGVRPASILICHIDADRPIDDHLAVLDTGANVSLDRVGDLRRCDDEARAQRLGELIMRGYTSQIMLSHDLARKSRLKAGGGHGYEHLFKNFLPRLRELAIPEETIEQIVVKNPGAFLDWDKMEAA